jgi:hypothetical protein
VAAVGGVPAGAFAMVIDDEAPKFRMGRRMTDRPASVLTSCSVRPIPAAPNGGRQRSCAIGYPDLPQIVRVG